jgi:RES domain-containing protein
VWRLTRRAFAASALSGEGAARYGNRWNSRGVRVGYASTGRALAVLEMLVHVTRNTVPPDLVFIPIEVPDELISLLPDLPAEWNLYPYRPGSRTAGDRWAREGVSAALLVPSAVLPAENNLLINPLHPDFPKVKVHAFEEQSLDPRLFGGENNSLPV